MRGALVATPLYGYNKEVKMKIIIINLLLILIVSFTSFAQGLTEFERYDDAMVYLNSLYPKEEEYKFNIPSDWTSISLVNAKVVSVSEGEDIVDAQKIIDGETNTSWKTKNYYSKQEAVIDLGSKTNFNTIVIYNRQSNNRGSGGGNDALKTVEIGYSNQIDSNFISLGRFELEGPKAVCVKIKGAGQVCTFIDNTKPNIIEIPIVNAKYLKLSFIEAFWGEDIPNEWRDSFSLTEVMLFNK